MNQSREGCVYINRIATAVPDFDVHSAFIGFAENMLDSQQKRDLFRRLTRLSGIQHRFSYVRPELGRDGTWVDLTNFYIKGSFPNTARRMELFELLAPKLAHVALDRLALSDNELRRISHVVVTSCTGLYAPGLDFEVVDYLGLDRSAERTMIGFMGCYAAINALKLARHIVRSEPESFVLVLNLELCSLHFRETQKLEEALSFLLFGDGCAASLISSEPIGLGIDSFRAITIPQSRDLITWKIRELGFDMMLSGRVPIEIGRHLGAKASDITGDKMPNEINLWAVHPGGRSVLDAVEQGLNLSPNALHASRDILARFGNMSSATVMFVLESLMGAAKTGDLGCGMSFGPGLTAETLLFHAA